jgi:hypothetical protein
MSLDPQILEKHGVTVEKLKEKFTAEKPDEKTQLLINLIRSRINEGINKSIREARHWWAIDQAFDAPFRQISPTLAKSLLSTKMDDAGVLKAQDWGLTHLIREQTDAHGKVTRTIDLPAFFEVTVPVAKAYAIIRTAKIFNDRNIYPLFKYEPARLTLKNKTRCEIITDRVQAMTSQYGYAAIMRQAILSKMIYGTCLMFPAECWHTEKQIHENKDGAEEVKIVKEGLRYNLPHPSRVFWDLNYRLGTFNTDTGCSYAGYWQVQRYGDIKDNDAYWNTDKITYGTDWMTHSPTFFSTLYPCVCKFPNQTNGPPNATSTATAGNAPTAGAGAMDRESAAGFYAADETDKAVTLTQLFMKLTPKKYGWGDYPHPVWFRLVVVNESTVIYVEVLAYHPVIYRGYDAHEERELNSSLVLETLPFQDHIGNLISQQILTIKQNLIAAAFVNEDAVGKGTMDNLKNLGQRLYVEMSFIPFSAKTAAFAGKDIKEAFIPVSFPRLDTTSILNGIRTLLDMMERILVMSSQEIGAAAAHEQTAEETRVIQSSTSNRLNFTASYDDDADLAWKKQLYDALMAYGEEDVYAQIETLSAKDVKNTLEDLGFTVEEEGDAAKNTKTLVKGSKTALLYESFASTRDSGERINNIQLANAMVQLLQVVFSNPLIFQAIGPAQAVKLINQVVALGGFFAEFKLETIPGASPEEQNAKAKEEVSGMLAQLKAVLEKEMQQTVGAAVQPLAQGLQQLAQQIQGIGQATQQLGEAAKQSGVAIPQLAQQMAAMQDGVQKALQGVGQKDAEQDAAIGKIMQVLQVAMQGAQPPPQPQPVAQPMVPA